MNAVCIDSVSIGSLRSTFSRILFAEEGFQVALHTVTSTDDRILAGGANLRVHRQLIITTTADEMAGGTLHNPGILGEVVKADGAFWVRNLRSLNRSSACTLINEAFD